MVREGALRSTYFQGGEEQGDFRGGGGQGRRGGREGLGSFMERGVTRVCLVLP